MGRKFSEIFEKWFWGEGNQIFFLTEWGKNITTLHSSLYTNFLQWVCLLSSNFLTIQEKISAFFKFLKI